MGFTPNETKSMSLWEFVACFEGFYKANTPEDKEKGGMTNKEAQELSDILDRRKEM